MSFMVCDNGNFMYYLVIVAWMCCFMVCVCCFMIMWCGGDVSMRISCFVVAVCTCCFVWYDGDVCVVSGL